MWLCRLPAVASCGLFYEPGRVSCGWSRRGWPWGLLWGSLTDRRGWPGQYCGGPHRQAVPRSWLSWQVALPQRVRQAWARLLLLKIRCSFCKGILQCHLHEPTAKRWPARPSPGAAGTWLAPGGPGCRPGLRAEPLAQGRAASSWLRQRGWLPNLMGASLVSVLRLWERWSEVSSRPPQRAAGTIFFGPKVGSWPRGSSC